MNQPAFTSLTYIKSNISLCLGIPCIFLCCSSDFAKYQTDSKCSVHSVHFFLWENVTFSIEEFNISKTESTSTPSLKSEELSSGHHMQQV